MIVVCLNYAEILEDFNISKASYDAKHFVTFFFAIVISAQFC